MIKNIHMLADRLKTKFSHDGTKCFNLFKRILICDFTVVFEKIPLNMKSLDMSIEKRIDSDYYTIIFCAQKKIRDF